MSNKCTKLLQRLRDGRVALVGDEGLSNVEQLLKEANSWLGELDCVDSLRQLEREGCRSVIAALDLVVLVAIVDANRAG